MKEKLADINLRSETEEVTLEAKTRGVAACTTILDASTSNLETSNRPRHFSVGLLRVERPRILCQSTNLVQETADLYIKALQLDGALDEPRGVEVRVNTAVIPLTSRPASPPESEDIPGPRRPSAMRELSQALAWCRESSFDIDTSSGFRFETCDFISRTSPLHKAIQDENVDVLRRMVGHVASLETGGDPGIPTPLLFVASTKNRDCVGLLLQNGARADVRDSTGLSPLHRCQSKVGGVNVAKLLLNNTSILLDVIDNSGKTALFMACEMGNEKMVRFPLEEGAYTNICHQTRRGPMLSPYASCTNLAQDWDDQALLSHGADPRLTDANGANAIQAANNAGLAESDIKRLLQEHGSAFPRLSSDASSSTTIFTRSSTSSDNGPHPSGRRSNLMRFWSKSESFHSGIESAAEGGVNE
ncbi:Putative ankyrin repeat-containing domain superfamily [Colletotrichum destructivum]|uniref:Ankyrin repeat-containing domain superfamily n=1 Tax=Colletotrichum destructivum TaxID=34406 RepID=A0AAX4I5Z9_9PEZI|nr:Putative ankyrin repeat-containing domain superfamily [Colletotrichum destructivum]